jgi:acetyl esterase/lipase
MLRLLRILLLSFFTTLRARWRRGRARPSWGFQFEWIITFLRTDFVESASWPYQRLRDDLDGRKYPSRSLQRVQRRRAALGGVPAVWFTPASARRGVVLFLHGGSFIFGSVESSHAEVAASLAERSGRAVAGLEYRLAPEHPYPAALEDALAAFDALVASGHPPSEIVVAGDSAGGNLALSLQLALRDRGQQQAHAALLFSPWLDLTGSQPSCSANDAIDYGQTSFLTRHARDYAGGVPLDDPRISPLGADLAGLAPLLVVAGEAERLIDECRAFVDRAKAAGVTAELCVAPDMPHNVPALAGFHPAAERAFALAGSWAASQLAG